MPRLTTQRILFGIAAWLWFAGAALPQSDPTADEVRRREQIAAQALEQEIQSAIAAADKLKSEPAKALEALRSALARLETDTTMDLVAHAKLMNTIKERIKTNELAIERAKKAAEGDKVAPSTPSKEQSIQAELEAIRSLEQAGKTAEAQRRTDELASRYPNNPALQGRSEIARQRDAVNENEDILKAKSSGTLAFKRGLDKSATPIPGDIAYPPGWKEKMDARAKKQMDKINPLTEREKEILRILDDVTSAPIVLKDISLEDIVKFLQKEAGLPILVNKAALDDVKVGYDSTLSISLPKGVSKRSVLRSVLAELGLTYVIKNEAIEVTSPAKAQSEMVTRILTIDDLFRSQLSFGGGGVGAGNPISAQELIDLITSTIEPNTWKKNGGLGDITYFAPTRTLIIKNSAEVINRLGLSSKQP
jgi:tetratricopeptide (TPR) repeat protein